MKLITAAECVRKMRQAGVYKGKESYFSQLVQKGVIPSHTKEGSPKKWYVLDEVKKALKGWEDPSRDSQREANDKIRNENDLKTQYYEGKSKELSIYSNKKKHEANDLYITSYMGVLEKYNIEGDTDILEVYKISRAVNIRLAIISASIGQAIEIEKLDAYGELVLANLNKVVSDEYMTFEDIESAIAERSEF